MIRTRRRVDPEGTDVSGERLQDWLRGGPRVLDGAMGSELHRLGGQAAGTLWGVGTLMEQPDLVHEVHRRYVAAGAEALTAATFRIAPYALRALGLEARAGELAAAAVGLAREAAAAADPPPLVFASQTTLEDCYRPDLVPDAPTLLREHAATAAALAAARPDALLLETFNTTHEARAACAAATATGLPVLVAFTCLPGGRLLSGEDVGAAAAAVTQPGVVAVGVNCTRVPDLMAALNRVAAATPLPVAAYANNAWFAADSPWLEAEEASPEQFGVWARAWMAAGARLVGGCCGTTAEHIAAVAREVRHWRGH